MTTAWKATRRCSRTDGPAVSLRPGRVRQADDRPHRRRTHRHGAVSQPSGGRRRRGLVSFGSPEFKRLRESFWLQGIEAAVAAGRSTIFTFAPEPTVAADFPQRLIASVEAAGGRVLTVALDVDAASQDARIDAAERAAFGKLRSVDLLRELRPAMAQSMAAMPPADLRIDTRTTPPAKAADQIVASLSA